MVSRQAGPQATATTSRLSQSRRSHQPDSCRRHAVPNTAQRQFQDRPRTSVNPATKLRYQSRHHQEQGNPHSHPVDGHFVSWITPLFWLNEVASKRPNTAASIESANPVRQNAPADPPFVQTAFGRFPRHRWWPRPLRLHRGAMVAISATGSTHLQRKASGIRNGAGIATQALSHAGTRTIPSAAPPRQSSPQCRPSRPHPAPGREDRFSSSTSPAKIPPRTSFFAPNVPARRQRCPRLLICIADTFSSVRPISVMTIPATSGVDDPAPG